MSERFRVPRRRRSVTGASLALILPLAGMTEPLSAQAPSGAWISGVVLEAEGSAPIQGATVRLSGDPGLTDRWEPGAEGAFIRVGRTDRDGRYAFVGVPAGSYRLAVSRLGYRSAILWITVPLSSSIERSVELAMDPVPLDSLRVFRSPEKTSRADGTPDPGATASTALDGSAPGPRHHPLDARRVSRDDIRMRGQSGFGEADVFRSLRRLPGASSRGDHSSELWTRGAPWGLTTVLFDGMPIYDPLHMGGATASLSADALDSALFLPGVRPAPISRGVAGTVNLSSRRAGEDPERGLGVSPVAVRAHWDDRWIGDRLGLALTARRSWWDWLEPATGFAGGGPEGSIDYYFTDVTGRVDLRLPAGLILEAGGLRAEDRLDGAVRQVVGASRGVWRNRVGWAALEREWRGALRIRAMGGRTSHSAVTRSKPFAFFVTPEGIPTLDWTELDLGQTLARLTADGGVRDWALRWTVGLERTWESLSQQGMEAYDRGAPGLDGPVTVERDRAWLQTEVDRRYVLVSAGLAWDVPFEGDPPEIGPLPNARLRFKPHDALHLEAGWGRSSQTAYPLAPAGQSVGPALGVGQVWMLAGEGIPPLIGEVGTLGVEATLPLGFRLGATVWQRDIQGVVLNGVHTIREGRLARLGEEGGFGQGEGRGMELFLQRRSGRLTGSLGYSRSQSEIFGPEGDAWASPADREHALDLEVTVRPLEGLRASLFFTWETGWPYSEGPWACEGANLCEIEPGDPRRPLDFSFERAPDYRTADLQLDWERRGDRIQWGLSASLHNLLGWENTSAFRPRGCDGRALVSVVCRNPVGVGWFAPGLGGPTPALSLRVMF